MWPPEIHLRCEFPRGAMVFFAFTHLKSISSPQVPIFLVFSGTDPTIELFLVVCVAGVRRICCFFVSEIYDFENCENNKNCILHPETISFLSTKHWICVQFASPSLGVWSSFAFFPFFGASQQQPAAASSNKQQPDTLPTTLPQRNPPQNGPQP